MNARWSVLALLACAPSVQAGGFDPKHVASDAKSVLHVDMAALGRSAILRALHADGQLVENEFDVDGMRTRYGLEPFVDLFSITSYTTGDRGQDTVTIVTGNDRLAEAWGRLAKSQPAPIRVGGSDAIRFDRGPRDTLVALLPQRAGAPRTAVIARNERRLKDALLVLAGEAPTMETAQAASSSSRRPKDVVQPITARPQDGSLVFAASAPGAPCGLQMTDFLKSGMSILCEVSDLASTEQESVALAARTLEFDLGETGADLVMRLTIDTSSPSDAQKIEDVLRGAMAKSAAFQDAPEAAQRLKRIFDAIRLESPAARLTATFRYDAGQIVKDSAFIEESRGIRPRR